MVEVVLARMQPGLHSASSLRYVSALTPSSSNTASRMKLVEVIPAFDTSPETLDTAMRLMRDNDKVAVKIKDVAGFAVNRMFLIFLNEAVRLVEEGVATPQDN